MLKSHIGWLVVVCSACALGRNQYHICSRIRRICNHISVRQIALCVALRACIVLPLIQAIETSQIT